MESNFVGNCDCKRVLGASIKVEVTALASFIGKIQQIPIQIAIEKNLYKYKFLEHSLCGGGGKSANKE